MPLKSKSSKQSNDLPWLQKYYDKTKSRTVSLAKRSVDVLIECKEPVTLANISKISKRLDPLGKGIHPNSIRNNEEAYAYYAENSISYRKKITSTNNRHRLPKNIQVDFNRIKADRDLNTLRRKYRHFTKGVLIERLIQAEQFIADNQEKWLAQLFEDYGKDD